MSRVPEVEEATLDDLPGAVELMNVVHDDGLVTVAGWRHRIESQPPRGQQRLFKAGVEVIEARISHLAYAPEIAAAMLRRQQASAVIAARQKIVEGAVSMVEMALNMIAKHNVVEMDEKAKAGMVANLMVVLCAEHNVQPVVNTGHTGDRSS